jgi:uncharacterized membrane protein
MRVVTPGRVFAALSATALAALFLYGPMSGPRFTHLSDSTVIKIPIRDLPRDGGRFYSVEDAGRQLRFVLARDENGKVRSVFDACGQCYRYKKGFSVAHGEMICRLCGNRYPLKHMMTGRASCAPVPLASTVTPDSVIVKATDIRKGAWLF